MHETTDMNPKYAVYFVVGLSIVLLLTCIGLWWMFRTLVGRQQRAESPTFAVQPERVVPPEPRLEVNPTTDYGETLAREEDMLRQYEWIDRQKGIARIPIERAMDILAQEKAPSR